MVQRVGKAGKAYICTRCGNRGLSERAVCALPCTGLPRLARAAHRSHRLWLMGPSMVWCSACAAFGSTRLRLLGEPCLGAPRNKRGEASLKQLKEEKDPSTKKVVGRSFRLTIT